MDDDAERETDVTKKEDEKVCPRCAETVKAAALICKHCSYEFGTPVQAPSKPQSPAPTVIVAPAKKGHPILIGCAAIVGILFVIGIIGAANTPSKDTTSADSADTSSEPAQEVLQVTSMDLAQAYSANEVAAQNAYGGKTLDVTGVVTGITLDFKNDPVVQLRGVNEFLPVQASFDDSYKDKLSEISKGQQITVRCTSITEVISAPMLDDCTLP